MSLARKELNFSGSTISHYDVERKDMKTGRWVKVNTSPVQGYYRLSIEKEKKAINNKTRLILLIWIDLILWIDFLINRNGEKNGKSR